MSQPVDIHDGEAFGARIIRTVQAGIGRDSILAGNEGRQRQIRHDFDDAAGRLVAWVIERERAARRTEPKGAPTP